MLKQQQPKKMSAQGDGVKTTPKGELVFAGTIGAAHGIKGEVRFASDLENLECIKKEGVLFTKNKAPFFINAWRQTAKDVFIRFENTPDRTAAEALRGTELYLDACALPSLKPGEFYYKDIIGLVAINHLGEKVGRVASVFYSGAQHILVIQQAAGKEALIPFLDDMVGEVGEDALLLKEGAQMFFEL